MRTRKIYKNKIPTIGEIKKGDLFKTILLRNLEEFNP